MAIKFNKKEYEEGNQFDKLPAGQYKVVCSTNSKNTVNKDGKDQLVLELDVISSTDGDVTQRGKKVWYYVTEGAYASSMLGQAIVGFGLPFPEDGECPAIMFIGRTASIEVKHNGDFVNVKKFLKAEAQTGAVKFESQETEEDPF